MQRSTSTAALALLATFGLFHASTASAVELKVSGFVKAAVVGSDRSASSLGQDNLSAATAARPSGMTPNLATVPANEDGEMSFQVQQTRLNMELKTDDSTRGVVEVDFYDSTKASPTTQAVPRLRIAKVEHKLNDHLTLSAGQDWDIFGPLTTFTYNYVGNSFQAGNTGFMRNQLVLADKHENFELKYAIGMLGANATAAAGDTDRSDYPSLAFSAAFGTAGNQYGVSGLLGRTVIHSGSSRVNRDTAGLNLFAEKSWTSLLLRAEVYYGQNLANAGTLAISQGTFGSSLTEIGGFVSGKLLVSEATSVFATAGYAQIMNSDEVTPVAMTTNVAGAAVLSMRQNLGVKLGADYKLTDSLKTYGELSEFHTLYAGPGDANTFVGEIGLFLSI